MPKNFNPSKQPFLAGEIALVGAGPGDPDLLTLQAYRFICQADVAIYDRLVSKEIMALLPEDCELVYVGKKQADHRVPQERINEILVEQAKLGKKVLRLKGGDPFVFGRGGEEALFALEQGISCHIVPGMTAASACAAYAGIPLTHRQVSRACTFITGHIQNDGSLDLPWTALQDKKQTIVFYMGVKTLDAIVQQLYLAGRDRYTPVALIQRGTTPQQKVVKGVLEDIVRLVAEHQIKPPTLIMIGDVVDTFSDYEVTNLGYIAGK